MGGNSAVPFTPPVSSNKVAATTLIAAELLFPYLCQRSSAFWEVVVSNTREVVVSNTRELPRDSPATGSA